MSLDQPGRATILSDMSIDRKKIRSRIAGLARRLAWPLGLVIACVVLSQVINMAAEVSRLATENEQMRTADEGMLRARTNFERPGITQEQVDQIRRVAEDYGMPEDVAYAFFRTERGRRGLYMGANKISPEIRKRYPPLVWQFAQAAKTWNGHLNKMATTDIYLRRRAIWSFARQWNPDPEEWTASAMANLELVRAKGLEVTEPPKARQSQSVISSKDAEARASKAIGAGHKRPTHTSKEKKR